jgi:hypothetical protein
MPTYVDLLRLFEQATQSRKQNVLELPHPIEEIFPETSQQHTLTPLPELLKKDYEHLVTMTFKGR